MVFATTWARVSLGPSSTSLEVSRAPKVDGSVSPDVEVRTTDTTNPVASTRPSPTDGVNRTGKAALYEDLMGQLRAAGIKKVLVGERHDRQRNMEAVCSVLVGAADVDAGATLYREMDAPASLWRDSKLIELKEGDYRDPSRKPDVVDQVISRFHRGWFSNNEEHASDFSEATRRRLKETLDGNIKLEPMAFDNPTRRDMRAFLDDKGFAVASLGAAHAMYELAGVNQEKIPWSAVLRPTIPAFTTPAISEEAQADIYNGFARAQAVAPSVLVLQSQAWSTEVPRDVVQGYYRQQGFGVMELPLAANNVTVTVIVPASHMSVLTKFAMAHSTDVKLLAPGRGSKL